MFGFGPGEVVIVIIVALILINPKDLPKIVRKIGKIYGKLMKQINMVKKTYGQFEDEVKYLTDLNSEEEKKEKRNDWKN